MVRGLAWRWRPSRSVNHDSSVGAIAVTGSPPGRPPAARRRDRAAQGSTPRTLGVCNCLGCCDVSVLWVSWSLFPDGGRAWLLPACRGGGGARFHGPRPRTAGRFPPSPRLSRVAAVYPALGVNMVTRGFPVMVCLVAAVCRNFGRAFWARWEWRSRLGTFRVCSAARAAASAAAASASSDDVAVTWEDVMARTA